MNPTQVPELTQEPPGVEGETPVEVKASDRELDAAKALAEKYWDLGNALTLAAVTPLIGFLTSYGSSADLRNKIRTAWHVWGQLDQGWHHFSLGQAVCLLFLALFSGAAILGVRGCFRGEWQMRLVGGQISEPTSVGSTAAMTVADRVHRVYGIRRATILFVASLAVAVVVLLSAWRAAVTVNEYSILTLRLDDSAVETWFKDGVAQNVEREGLGILLTTLASEGWTPVSYAGRTGAEQSVVLHRIRTVTPGSD